MTPRPMPDTIETLRLTLQRLEQTTDPARDSAHLAAIKRVLLNIIAELEIAQALEVEIVNVSHHLGVLRTAGLVEDLKEGRFVVYSLHPKIFHNDSNKATYLDLGWCRVEIPHN